MANSRDILKRCQRGLSQGGAIREQALARLVEVSQGEDDELALEARRMLVKEHGTDDAARAALKAGGLYDLATAFAHADSDDVDKRWRAMGHLDLSLLPEARGLLEEGAQDQVARVRRAAVRSLGRSEETAGSVANCLGDRDFYVRHTALGCLLDLLLERDLQLWKSNRRDTLLSNKVRDALRDQVATELDDDDNDEVFDEMVAALGLWETEAVLDVGQRCCYLGHTPSALVHMLAGTGRAEDLEAILEGACFDREPQMAVFRALIESTEARQERVAEALIARYRSISEDELGLRSALALTAAWLGIGKASRLAREVFDTIWPVHPEGSICRRMIESLMLVQSPPDLAEEPIQRALDSSSGPLARLGRVAAYALLGADEEEERIVGYLEGNHIGSGKKSIRSIYDRLIGMNEDARLRGLAAHALRRAKPSEEIETALRTVIESRGSSLDSLGWHPRFAASETLLHLGLHQNEDFHGQKTGAYVALVAAELGHDVPIEALEQSLLDPVPLRRVRVLDVLAERSEPEVEALLEIRVRDMTPGVHRHAVALLATRAESG